ncbi:MAG: hypothetical protein RIB84_04235 [Sneathiellaceae bacterium]
MRMLPLLPLGALLASLAAWPVAAETDHVCAGVSATGQNMPGAADYSLKLVYAEPDGAYLGNITTQIAGADGVTLVDAHCDGPWLLAALPQGRYRVTAHFEGQTKTQDVNVGATGQTEQVIRF